MLFVIKHFTKYTLCCRTHLTTLSHLLAVGGVTETLTYLLSLKMLSSDARCAVDGFTAVLSRSRLSAVVDSLGFSSGCFDVRSSGPARLLLAAHALLCRLTASRCLDADSGTFAFFDCPFVSLAVDPLSTFLLFARFLLL